MYSLVEQLIGSRISLPFGTRSGELARALAGWDGWSKHVFLQHGH